jgi:hypothetical protein
MTSAKILDGLRDNDSCRFLLLTHAEYMPSSFACESGSAQPRYSGSTWMFDSKARLDALNFASIDEMIRAYADEAVLVARQGHRVVLDYTPASVDALERLLDGQAAVDLDFQSRLWGSYFGEVLRRRWHGMWLLAPYPGTREQASDASSVIPTLDVAGSRLWPTMKVYRRLTLGAAENLSTFYRLVEQRLAGATPRPN